MVFEILSELRRNEGKAIVMVEQNAKKGLEFADVGYVLVSGSVAMVGKRRRAAARSAGGKAVPRRVGDAACASDDVHCVEARAIRSTLVLLDEPLLNEPRNLLTCSRIEGFTSTGCYMTEGVEGCLIRAGADIGPARDGRGPGDIQCLIALGRS